MKEVDIRLALHHALQWRGWSPKHWQDGRYIVCSKCGHKGVMKPDKKGRADTKAEHYSLPVLDTWIEVKDCKDTAFAFSEISEEQRTFLDEHHGSYICIGRIVPKGETKTTIHSIYVIPWGIWKALEAEVDLLTGGKSIPYDYTLYTNKVEVKCTDMVSRFPMWKLERRDDGWHFKDTHPLAVQDEIETPHYMREKETKWANAEKVPTSP